MTAHQALALAEKGELKAAEDAVIAVLEQPQSDLAPWIPVLETLIRNSPGNSVETLAWAALDTLAERLAPRDAARQSGAILRLFSKNDEFRARAVELYQRAYEGAEGLENLIDISGLRGGKPIRRALQTLEICLTISPGQYLAHRHDGPAAQVVEVDREHWTVRLRTPQGEELFDPVSLGDQYDPADASDFRVLQQFDPEGFAETLQSNPADIIIGMLKRHQGELTSYELESLLSPRHIPRNEWSKWWSKARAGLQKKPRVTIEGRDPAIIRYQAHEVPIDDQTWERFNPQDSPKSWLDLAQQYVRECETKGLPQNKGFLIRLRDAVRVEAQSRFQRKDPLALASLLAEIELSKLAGEPGDDSTAAACMQSHANLAEAFGHLGADVFWPMALQVLQRHRPETWPRDFAALLPITAPNRCDAMARQLREAGHGNLLQGVVDEIMNNPVTNINGLSWLYQGPRELEGVQVPPLITLITRMLSVLDQIQHAPNMPVEQLKETRARVRAALSSRRQKRLQECIEQIEVGSADALQNQLRRVVGLSDNLKADLIGTIRHRFPEMWAKPKKKPWQEDAVLYCTESGFAAKQAELDELVNVKMKENAKAIGEAAAKGDLSENSEYKFALEERDLLRARVAEIQNQMAAAQVISDSEVETSEIGIGTRVRLQNRGTGQPMQLTFLGPWEADVDRNVLNYKAPLSQQLMGLSVGDTVQFDFAGQKGEFEIVSIENALARSMDRTHRDTPVEAQR